MTAVTVERISKRYHAEQIIGGENRLALAEVSLQIADGETLSIVGPSGCGKSTLLRTVAGLERPDQGAVRFGEVDVTQVAPQERGVGMVFQDYALYPSMKSEGNLRYYFQVHKRTEEEAAERARETAQLMGVGFEHLLGRTPTTLSGGEQQRVAIARCIVHDPLLFLMDEPICNLDAKLREQTRIEVKRLLRRFGITTLYVTHDQSEALFMGDRICIMRAGRVEQIGDFDELYYTPANLFVATFIGAPPMAVLPVAADDGKLVSGEARWDIPESLRPVITPGDWRLGVRPDGWTLGAEHGTRLTVRRIERVPTEQAAYLHGDVAGRPVTVVAPIDIPPTNQTLVLPRWDQVYLFAPEGEEILVAPGVPDPFALPWTGDQPEGESA